MGRMPHDGVAAEIRSPSCCVPRIVVADGTAGYERWADDDAASPVGVPFVLALP